ncbi:nuclear cap-binding protein subunit 3 isoform X4 [Myotis lucifugus]|uniref:nuclear cap-binding protein subunit 3 isoform X4 n=1 Tax=Myotis lucifugus TaxID=59463 RepID=UPI000CCBD8BF|nr:nuclear cap-binding protein subunit 3 isoform X4 [Myotis lucifugus]
MTVTPVIIMNRVPVPLTTLYRFAVTAVVKSVPSLSSFGVTPMAAPTRCQARSWALAHDETPSRSLCSSWGTHDTSRRYENKAGSFITGIDVTSKEAIEKKEQRAKRFHLRSEVDLAQRNIALDRDMMKKAIPKVRLETIYICGVDEMSTQDIFSYFKEYPPAHIEWLDDTSCNVVWLDEMTATRALINMSSLPDLDKIRSRDANEDKSSEKSKKDKQEDSSDDEAEEGEVEDENSSDVELETLSQVEEESLLRNDLRPANKLAKGNKLFMRFATKDDKKELGAARRSQYYMKYGNPNYGGMKGILSNSWKRRYHSRRIQRDVIKKRAMIGDDVGLTSYKHRHSGLVNVPEEPIEEEEEEEEEDQDMDADDRVVVEYHEELPALKQTRERSSSRRSSASSSDSDEMDYDLELKMISTPSPKKSMKMTMYADEVESQLKNIRNSMRSDTISTSNIKNRIGNKLPPEKFADVRHLLDEKRQHTRPRPSGSSTKSGSLWTRLGSASKTKEKNTKKVDRRAPGTEEDDSELQRAWGALIKEKEQSRQKKSRSSKEQRTELLTIALALTAVTSTLFPRKVNSQVLIGQPSRGKMREAASSLFQDPSVGAESHGPDLRGAPVLPR